MRLWPSGWLILIALLLIAGGLRVAQQTALLLRGYALEARASALHQETVRVSWLSTDVSSLAAPSALLAIAEHRHKDFVAQSTWPDPSVITPARVASTGGDDE